MPHFPLIGRISGREYSALVFGFFFLLFETLLRLVIFFLPKPIILWFYDRSRSLFHHFAGQPKGKKTKCKPKELLFAESILKAPDFEELCRIHGYTHEEHVVMTKDGYLLGLHRLPSKKGHRKINPGTSTGRPVVYLHHGLLMNSEVWVCLTDAERSLPFVLVEAGKCSDQWCGTFVI
jgi:lysosomal acid lipase/cholesteryl ester hydrolase